MDKAMWDEVHQQREVLAHLLEDKHISRELNGIYLQAFACMAAGISALASIVQQLAEETADVNETLVRRCDLIEERIEALEKGS